MKKAIWQATVIFGLAAVGAVMTWAFHPRAPALYLVNEPLAEREVTLERIAEEWKGDVVWVDARSTAEYENGHYPGALLLNEEDWNDLLWEHAEVLQTAGKPVVVYCGRHGCEASRKVAERLRQNIGLDEVYFLRGGWKALQEEAGDRR